MDIEILLCKIDALDAKLVHLIMQDKMYGDEWEDTQLEIMATRDTIRELEGDIQ